MIVRYLKAILVALDVLADAILGGPEYMTISGRIGKSIREGTWAANVPWPASWRQHFLNSDYQAEV